AVAPARGRRAVAFRRACLDRGRRRSDQLHRNRRGPAPRHGSQEPARGGHQVQRAQFPLSQHLHPPPARALRRDGRKQRGHPEPRRLGRQRAAEAVRRGGRAGQGDGGDQQVAVGARG
ncbi:hypothetical protein LTR53_019934, partial [Teratosphaeriaceae sp. CCFEE 6253]